MGSLASESEASSSPVGFGLLPGGVILDESSSPPAPSPIPLVDSPNPGTDPDGCPVTMFKYVDDTTLVEVVHRDRVIRHVSAAGPRELVPTTGVGAAMEEIITKAESIGMVVNCRKTQMLCLSVDNGYLTEADLNLRGIIVPSLKRIKLLGFNL